MCHEASMSPHWVSPLELPTGSPGEGNAPDTAQISDAVPGT